MSVPYSLTLSSLCERLRSGRLSPVQLARDVLAAAAEGDRCHAWIFRLPEQAVLAQAQRLEADASLRSLPLYGIPFAIKDNIDAAGYSTTAACPAYSYVAGSTATAVRRLIEAGALLIGKTNLDQFATGLVGTRSPYGACANAFDSRYISGGSSSGSAVAVALNLVSFALGTDTAGSGRVPAGFNNIVGLKPTRGAISAAGVVPACRSLDCVSVFACTVEDAWKVYQAARGYDAADPYSRHPSASVHAAAGRFRCGVPAASQLDFCGDAEAARMFAQGCALIARAGGDIVEIDYAPFRETAALLYQGPWVAERLAAIRPFFDAHQDEMHPVTRAITARGADFSAVDAFEAGYRLQELRRQAAAQMQNVDVLAVPTAPTIYTLEQIEADPVRLNSNLGLYTNFANLLDLAAIAVPSGLRADGLPSGITLVAPAFSEPLLCELGARVHRLSGMTLGATGFALAETASAFVDPAGDAHVTVAVVGAHLSGMPLNHQLTDRGARLLGQTRTAPHYRLHCLPDSTPPKPGLMRCADGQGHAIEVELWRMPVEEFGSFVALIPAPLAIGTLTLEDNSVAQGFLCESHALAQARDISEFGGWRSYMASQKP
jgi:allophanate hydrolase